MELIELFWGSVIFFAVVLTGMIYGLGYLIKKNKELRKPKTRPVLDKEKMEKLKAIITGLNLEEKVTLLRMLFGNIDIGLHSDSSGIVLTGCGRLPYSEPEEPEEPIDYAG